MESCEEGANVEVSHLKTDEFQREPLDLLIHLVLLFLSLPVAVPSSSATIAELCSPVADEAQSADC